jgi:hypothetical protein
MAHSLQRIVAVVLLTSGLAACGNDKTPAPPVVVPPAPKVEDQFGTNFGADYRNNPNTDAKDAAPGDIVPLSLTTGPVKL